MDGGIEGFDDGSPDGYDPLQLAREMAAQGITLVSLSTPHTYIPTIS